MITAEPEAEANTYTSLHYHVLFSTKNREPWLAPSIEQRVWEFIGGIARSHSMTALQVGGVEELLVIQTAYQRHVGSYHCSDIFSSARVPGFFRAGRFNKLPQ